MPWNPRTGLFLSMTMLGLLSDGPSGRADRNVNEQRIVSEEAQLLTPDLGTLPREPIGGWVSVPGSPFPFPLPEKSVEDAIPIVETMVVLLRKVPGNDPVSDALRVGYLAGLYASLGRFDKAEQLYGQALFTLGNRSDAWRSRAWLFNNQGMNRWKARSIARAAVSFRAAVAATLGEADRGARESRAIALQNLATMYHLLGDVEASEGAYLQALDLLRELGERRSRVFQETSNNLALLYGATGACESGQRILEGLLERGPVEDVSTRFLIVNDLGAMLRCLGRLDDAEARFVEALKLAGRGRARGQALSSLGATHFEMGKLDQARDELKEALAWLEPAGEPGAPSNFPLRATLGTVAFYQGDFGLAETLLADTKSVLSKEAFPNQSLLSEVNQGLALVALRRGERRKALELGRVALDLKGEVLDRVLAFGSETQRLAYQRTLLNYDHLAELGDADLLLEAVLRMKGAIEDSLLSERLLARRSIRPEDRERLDRIHGLKLAALETLARGRVEDRERSEDLTRAIDTEQSAMAKAAALPLRAERSKFDLARIRKALAEGQVLVEWVRFHVYQSGKRLDPRYGAVVLPRTGPPIWVPLGSAGPIDESIARLRQDLEGRSRGARPDLPGEDLALPAAPLQQLFDLLWRPLVARFPEGTRDVVISPDGALQFVPWAALVDGDERFLGERWRISLVGSGRDLLRPRSDSVMPSVLALSDGTGNLPYAREETRHLAGLARAQGWEATVLTGDQATERELFARPSPGILHLATHGGEMRGELTSEVETRLSRLPLYRGYVLLGGAARSLEAWSRGSVPPAATDGILTAEEAAGLDLSRTWLTVLSACRSGTGEARDGEGVLGLRRGFALAGTENLLFTLWSVDDRATAQFMERFYERLFATRDPASAFHETQVARLRDLRSTQGLRWAVSQAGGFVLSR